MYCPSAYILSSPKMSLVILYPFWNPIEVHALYLVLAFQPICNNLLAHFCLIVLLFLTLAFLKSSGQLSYRKLAA